jgi:NAD(P)-dependent dehydrogenase (short-subunit alcohol dehydrogenase family)
VHCDVAKEAEVEAAVDAAVAEFDGVDMLINNAGLYLLKYNQPFAALARDDLRALFDVNVVGIVNCTLACQKCLRGSLTSWICLLPGHRLTIRVVESRWETFGTVVVSQASPTARSGSCPCCTEPADRSTAGVLTLSKRHPHKAPPRRALSLRVYWGMAGMLKRPGSNGGSDVPRVEWSRVAGLHAGWRVG